MQKNWEIYVYVALPHDSAHMDSFNNTIATTVESRLTN